MFNINEKRKRLIKFVCIDDWNRPIFEVLDKGYYISDLNNLFSMDVTEKDIKKFYKDKELNEYLIYHGTSKYCEPEGYSMEEYNIELI